MRNYLLTLCFFILHLTVVFTQTHIPGGSVNGIWNSFGSPYIIYGDITIDANTSLSIFPGTTVRFEGHYKFIINGRLLAEGTSGSPIYISTSGPLTKWHGLRFIDTNNGQDSSKLDYAVVSYGSADATFGADGYGGGVYISNSSNVKISNSRIEYNESGSRGGGIYVDSDSAPLLSNNIIRNNESVEGGGIYLFDADDTDIDGGEVYENKAVRGGGMFLTTADCNLKGLTIRDNVATQDGGGIYFAGSVQPNWDMTDRCNIYRNRAYWQGMDLYHFVAGPLININIILDTFTVSDPDVHFIYPMQEFTLTSLNSKIKQVNGSVYVSPDGDDNNSGNSPAEALKTIDMALFIIKAESFRPESIRINLGIYSPGTTGEVFPLNWRHNTVLCPYSDDSPSIIDGEGAHQLVTCVNDSNFVFKNVVFQNGYADKGGAFYMSHDAIGRMDSVTIKSNESMEDGGGMYINQAKLEGNGLIVSNNYSGGEGGGFYLQVGGTLTLNDGVLDNNMTHSNHNGGGIYIGLANLVVKGTRFSMNKGKNGGAIYNFRSFMNIDSAQFEMNKTHSLDGGSIYSYLSLFDTIRNSTFDRDTARYGGSICLDESNMTIEGCQFTNNVGNVAGAIYALTGLNDDLVIRRSKFMNNYAVSVGALFYRNGDNCLIENSLFARNRSLLNSAAMMTDKSLSQLNHVTFSENEMINNYAGGLYAHESDITITNSIFWGNQNDEIRDDLSTINVFHSIVEGGLYGGFDMDPQFIDPAIDDYSLQATSPCIEAGDPAYIPSTPDIDLSLGPRVRMEFTDMGAYEYGVYWMGHQGHDWHKPSNWSHGVVPDQTTKVTIAPVYTNHPIVMDSNAKVGALYLKAGADIEVEDGRRLDVKN